MTRPPRLPAPDPRPRAPGPDLSELWAAWLPGESCPAAAAEALIDWLEARGRRR